MQRIEKEPKRIGSFDTFHNRALDLFAKRRFAEAESSCVLAIKIDPDHAGIHNLLGQVYLAQKRSAEAVTCFTRAVHIKPALANLHFNLALAYQADNRIDLAIQSLREAIKIDPGVPALHAKLGQLLSAYNSPVEAVTVLQHALSVDPKSVPIRLNLAQALTDLGLVEEAEKTSRSALFLNPKDPTAHRMLGRVHQLKGQFSDAVGCFETSISLQPVQAAAYFALCYSKRLAEEDRGLIQKMEGLLSGSIQSEADQILLQYALGKSFDDLGEYDRAFEFFSAANTLSKAQRAGKGSRYDPELEAQKVQHVVEMFPSEALSGRSSGDDRPVFIVGMIRSGTTLVEQILSRHPDCCAGGELRYWLENEPRMHFEWSTKADQQPDIDSWRLGYEVELDRVSVTAPRVTDKMPLNFWALGPILQAYPNAKIIHCRRNPLDTCLSIYVTPFRGGPEFGHDLESIGQAYRHYQQLMSHWRTAIGSSNLLEVDYEELVASPETTTRAMIEFIGLNWDDACLDARKSTHPVNTPSQWQVRQPLYRHSVNRWENYADFLGPVRDLVEPS